MGGVGRRLAGAGGARCVQDGTGDGTGGGDGRDAQWFMHDTGFYARHPGERETRGRIRAPLPGKNRVKQVKYRP
ncbi:hypothetical protein GCM10010310_51430 [Streptomyces violaceolatus]|uniref:Uncharacterized protein n=1 Tax=Streptomyces violaceolatus TaxID=67378 RepID=A0ABN3T5G5_9ACTN|nr:hypothetical protein GCM10010391_61310 [Streptomyces anthocyanicus]